MCFVTIIVLFWSAIRIVYWLSHTPTLYGVFSLILPLFVLPLLASAYAEVNYQGFQTRHCCDNAQTGSIQHYISI